MVYGEIKPELICNKSFEKIPELLPLDFTFFFSHFCRETKPVVSDNILHVVQDTIKKFPFSFESPTNQARIISGQEEGTFGWITTNYISGNLGVVRRLILYSRKRLILYSKKPLEYK